MSEKPNKVELPDTYGDEDYFLSGLEEQDLPQPPLTIIEPRDGVSVPNGNGGSVNICGAEMAKEAVIITNKPKGRVNLTSDLDKLASELLSQMGLDGNRYDEYGNLIQ